jgi:2-amino-4-hydroxy-6-hydroxymethyldihydropteridine diphosphokinase
MKHKVYLGLGTNLGDKFKNLKSAINALSNIGCKNFVESSVYISKPFGFKSNNNFLNMVIAMETDLSPLDLLKTCKQVEEEMGRKPKKRDEYVSRIIDIDILYFDELKINLKNLQIPHPSIKNRLFVLKPLVEIINEDHKDIKELLMSKLEIEKKDNLKKFILKKDN